MAKYDDAYVDYRSGMKYKDIADKYGVKESTVKSWKQRYWNKRRSTSGPPRKKDEPKKRRKGGQKGNINALGHGAPKKNANAVKHGLFAKYLPEETLAIVMELEDASPLDILWTNIKIKFAAILRMQKILFVADSEDVTRITDTKTSITNDPLTGGQKRMVSKSERIILAMEREEKFIFAQARAMETLTRMIKQYEDLAASPQASEEQRIRIQKLKAEVELIKRDTDGNDNKQDIAAYVDALRGEVEEVWSDVDAEALEAGGGI